MKGKKSRKPKKEEIKAEEPKAEEPKAEEPKKEEPEAGEPKAGEPKEEEPKLEKAQQETPETEKKKISKKKIVLILLIVFGTLLIVAAVLGTLFCMKYSDKWYIGTTINGVEISGETSEEAREKVLRQYLGYHLDITARNGKKLTINESDIDYVVSFASDWDELFDSQHSGSFIPFDNKTYDLEPQFSYDEEKLKKLLDESVLVKGEKANPVLEPVSARLEFDEDKMYYVCVPEIEGDTVKEDALYDAVKTAIDQQDDTLDLSDSNQYHDIYEAPEITSEDEELNKEILNRNKVILRFIRWDITDKVSEELTPKDINELVSFKNGKVKYKKHAIEKWVQEFCDSHYTMDMTRTFKSHTGEKVKVNSGDYGWQMDYDKTLEIFLAALKKKISKKDIENYINDPSKKNKKAVTVSGKPEWKNFGFAWNSKDPSKDWDTKNFIEVSLAEQKVYVFRDGEVAFTCNCISGRPIPKKKTAVGAFYLKEHQMNHVMVGEDYRIPTHYWVRITWSGIGFHPAPWQPWRSWSPKLYQWRGSHGCINLSPKDAETMYNISKTREMVFIY